MKFGLIDLKLPQRNHQDDTERKSQDKNQNRIRMKVILVSLIICYLEIFPVNFLRPISFTYFDYVFLYLKECRVFLILIYKVASKGLKLKSDHCFTQEL